MKAAELWIKVSDDKYKKNGYANSEYKLLLDIKRRIKKVKEEDEEDKRFRNLCAKLETTGNIKMFQNASTSCRYVSDGKNPLIRIKMEEFSQEPIVQLFHDFLMPVEVDNILKESLTFDFGIAPTTGDDDGYASGRLADSYFINEQKDNIGSFITKIKAR